MPQHNPSASEAAVPTASERLTPALCLDHFREQKALELAELLEAGCADDSSAGLARSTALMQKLESLYSPLHSAENLEGDLNRRQPLLELDFPLGLKFAGLSPSGTILVTGERTHEFSSGETLTRTVRQARGTSYRDPRAEFTKLNVCNLAESQRLGNELYVSFAPFGFKTIFSPDSGGVVLVPETWTSAVGFAPRTFVFDLHSRSAATRAQESNHGIPDFLPAAAIMLSREHGFAVQPAGPSVQSAPCLVSFSLNPQSRTVSQKELNLLHSLFGQVLRVIHRSASDELVVLHEKGFSIFSTEQDERAKLVERYSAPFPEKIADAASDSAGEHVLTVSAEAPGTVRMYKLPTSYDAERPYLFGWNRKPIAPCIEASGGSLGLAPAAIAISGDGRSIALAGTSMKGESAISLCRLDLKNARLEAYAGYLCVEPPLRMEMSASGRCLMICWRDRLEVFGSAEETPQYCRSAT